MSSPSKPTTPEPQESPKPTIAEVLAAAGRNGGIKISKSPVKSSSTSPNANQKPFVTPQGQSTVGFPGRPRASSIFSASDSKSPVPHGLYQPPGSRGSISYDAPIHFSTTPTSRRRNSSFTLSNGLLPVTSSPVQAVYSKEEIYVFLLSSKELATASDFVARLLSIGGLNDEILLSEFKTILIDIMAEAFCDSWDILNPRFGAEKRRVVHAPNGPLNHVDELLQAAFVLCNMDPKLLFQVLPVSFEMTVCPGLVSYITNEVPSLRPVVLFEARPYLPPKYQDPVDHGAEIRMRAAKSLEMGNVSLSAFNLDDYFGGNKAASPPKPTSS